MTSQFVSQGFKKVIDYSRSLWNSMRVLENGVDNRFNGYENVAVSRCEGKQWSELKIRKKNSIKKVHYALLSRIWFPRFVSLISFARHKNILVLFFYNNWWQDFLHPWVFTSLVLGPKTPVKWIRRFVYLIRILFFIFFFTFLVHQSWLGHRLAQFN